MAIYAECRVQNVCLAFIYHAKSYKLGQMHMIEQQELAVTAKCIAATLNSQGSELQLLDALLDRPIPQSSIPRSAGCLQDS